MLQNPESEGPGTNTKRVCSTRFGNSLIISASDLNNWRISPDEVAQEVPDRKFPINTKHIGGSSPIGISIYIEQIKDNKVNPF